MKINFAGKRILVTGAGQGIGRDLALRLSSYGANVFALSKTKEKLNSLVTIDPTIQAVHVDLANWAGTKVAVQNILPIDLLVNNAAVAQLSPFLDVMPEQFDSTFNVNVKAALNVSQVVAKSMIERESGGSIVNVSSQASQAALKDHTIYSASKAALDMLTKMMALELGPHKIRVNAVNPTVVLTEMGKLGWSDEKKAQSMKSKIPLGRFAEVDEVLDSIIYLLSDRSSMINGVCLPIDGGFLATYPLRCMEGKIANLPFLRIKGSPLAQGNVSQAADKIRSNEKERIRLKMESSGLRISYQSNDAPI